ncbi:hypothetical protein MNB_SV-13-1952 [hydrothermal vent metagenome]|uniref:Outer membrane protein beta-barrel domain-containing protein n=1 Tax=hydrothermal vent metagenome TaxID=652676 RepID=A0A1W1BM01_9ZZZZ
MKKILTTLALLTTLSLGNEYPMEFGLGYAPGDDSGDSITGFASISMVGGLGTRFEYSKNINEGSLFSVEEVSRYALFAVYTVPLTESVSLTPKMGLVKNDAEIQVGDVVNSVTGESTEFTYGLEVNYSYNDNMAFYVGYTDYGNSFDFDNFDTTYMDSANVTFGIKVGI